MEKPALVKSDTPAPEETIPLTDAQVLMLQGIEREVIRAMRDRGFALQMALAAAGCPERQIGRYDFDRKVLILKPQAAAPAQTQ